MAWQVISKSPGQTVASADVNQLQANLNSLKGGSPGDAPVSDIATLAGGGGAPLAYNFPAGSWDYPIANPAPLDTDTGSNGTIKRQLFDDSTEEFLEAVFTVGTLAGTETVTFEAYGYAVTAAASKNIELKFYHSAKANGENWDAAYSSKESGDLAIDGTQDQIDRSTWTETIANLGWSSNDQIRIKLSRIDASTDDLSGDYGVTHFKITIA